MRIRIGEGRLATVELDGSTRLNVDGLMYPTHCSLTFWNDDREEICVFATRDQLLKFGEKIVSEITRATT